MTRNNDRALHIREAIGSPGKPEEPYALGAHAKRYAAIMKGTPLDWARSIHTQWSSGELAPTTKQANGLKLRAMLKAIRLLEQSADAGDAKKVQALRQFLALTWGIKTAAEAVAEGEVEAFDALREAWGDAQLPPVDATVNDYCADYLLIDAAVRRLG